MTEEWRPVVGWEGVYEVSDGGRVRSLDRTVVFRDGRRAFYRGKTLKPRVDENGYHRYTLSLAKKRRQDRAHTLVLVAFVGPRPDGLEGCHNDGNPGNNRLDNLRWGTRSSNAKDRVMHRTHNMARKRGCPRGHLLQEPNLVPACLPIRSCLACARANSRAHSRSLSTGLAPSVDWSEADRIYLEILEAALNMARP